MSDGNEERKETQQRRERERQQDRGDWLDGRSPDEWQPERKES